MQERCNSIAKAMELRLSCTNPFRGRGNERTIVQNAILALSDKWLSLDEHNNNCTNEFYSPQISRYLVSDKCWCHVTGPKDECFSNYTATFAIDMVFFSMISHMIWLWHM